MIPGSQTHVFIDITKSGNADVIETCEFLFGDAIVVHLLVCIKRNLISSVDEV